MILEVFTYLSDSMILCQVYSEKKGQSQILALSLVFIFKSEPHIKLNEQPVFKLNIDCLLMQITIPQVEHSITVIAFTNDVNVPKHCGKWVFLFLH